MDKAKKQESYKILKEMIAKEVERQFKVKSFKESLDKQRRERNIQAIKERYQKKVPNLNEDSAAVKRTANTLRERALRNAKMDPEKVKKIKESLRASKRDPEKVQRIKENIARKSANKKSRKIPLNLKELVK